MAKTKKPPIIVTVHGIHNDPSWSNWQDEFQEVLTLAGLDGIPHIAFKYPFVSLPLELKEKFATTTGGVVGKLGNLLERYAPAFDRYCHFSEQARRLKQSIETKDIVEDAVLKLAGLLNSLAEEYEIQILAHSLGCYVAAEAVLATDTSLRVQNLLLMAPPLKRKYDVATLSKKVTNTIRVEWSPVDDLFKGLLEKKSLLKGIKPAWLDDDLEFMGLTGPSGHSVVDSVKLEGFSHTDFVLSSRALRDWLPYLGFMHPPTNEELVEWYDSKLRNCTLMGIESYFGGQLSNKELVDCYVHVRTIALENSLTVEGIRSQIGRLYEKLTFS